jgi:hypothetical protein
MNIGLEEEMKLKTEKINQKEEKVCEIEDNEF